MNPRTNRVYLFGGLKVETTGDTGLLPGSVMDKFAFQEVNDRLLTECVKVRDPGQSRFEAARIVSRDAFETIDFLMTPTVPVRRKMIGEDEFASLVHQGEKESMYLADVAKRVILVVLFDQRATLGLVKLKAKAAVEHLNRVFEDMFNRVGTGGGPTQQQGLLEGAEDEIDKLFG